MNLFDVTPYYEGGRRRDDARTASIDEVRMYLTWLAHKRGVVIPHDPHFDHTGIFDRTAKEYVLEMPGADWPGATMETLDDDGNVIRSTPLAVKSNGYLVMTATQIKAASGLKASRKAKAAKTPVQHREPESAVLAHEAPESLPSPTMAETAPISAPMGDSALLARVEALEAMMTRMGLAIGGGVPAAANDDVAVSRVRSEAERKAIMRAWAMRRTMRRRVAVLQGTIDALTISVENRDASLSQWKAEAEAACERERILMIQLQAAGDEIEADREAAAMLSTYLDQARDAAMAHKGEADRLERALWSERERAGGSVKRAERMVRVAADYRKQAKRAKEDTRAAQAEARAAMRRLDDARRANPPVRVVQAAPPPTDTAMAVAFAEART